MRPALAFLVALCAFAVSRVDAGSGPTPSRKSESAGGRKATIPDKKAKSGARKTVAKASPAPQEEGTRSPESILRVIRQHIGGFRYSYNKALRDKPGMGGKISLKFTISPAGDITAISVVESNTGNPGLDEEIKDKARRMKFDAIEEGNVTITYSFILDKK